MQKTNKKIKILHIAQSDGGVLEYLSMFCKNIDHVKYENYLIVSDSYKKEKEKFEELVKEIHYIKMEREIKISSDLKAIIEVNKLVSKIKPDIVYLHSSKAGAIGRIALLFNFKVKILYNAHGWAFNGGFGNKKKVYAIIEKILAFKTTKIINISKSEYESALQNKISKISKMCVIDNGIDFEIFKNSEKYRNKKRKEYSIEEKEIVIGVVGRISEQKDPITFIKAAKILNEKYSNLKFMYIGAGELEKSVINYCEEEKLINKLIITGWVRNKQEYIPMLDVAVLPSKWEGFGLVLIEYMICKKPIVASNIGGIVNIVEDNKNGLLFDPGNEKELAKKIELLIKNNHKVEEMVNINYLYCSEKYNIQNLIENHYKLFDSL